MLKTRAIKKIFLTTIAMFVILTVFSLSKVEQGEVIHANLEFEEISSISTNSIYLLDQNGYLVKTSILLDDDSISKRVSKVLNNLIQSEVSKFSNGLFGTIPAGTKIRDVFCGNNLVTIDFSKDILKVDVDKERQMISSIVFSVLDIEDIKGVSILVEGKALKEYPNTKEKLPVVLDKSIGINKQFDITERNNITGVVIYYVENIDDNLYYVPVTKYVNDDRDKIKIIIEELTTSYIYEKNLMSFLNSKTKLLEYREEDDVFFLNFNEYLFDSNDKVLEEVLYSIAYSIFDNYNVDMVMFEVNGKNIEQIKRP